MLRRWARGCAAEIPNTAAPTQHAIAPWTSLALSVACGSKELEKLTWREFEDLMAEILKESGWIITPMGYTNDKGIDIIAARTIDPGIPIRMMVQCKKYARMRPVGISVVREVWAVQWQNGFHQAMVATTSSFTRGAVDRAEAWYIDLRDHDAIISWCKNIVDHKFS